jgi:hypothetical protein
MINLAEAPLSFRCYLLLPAYSGSLQVPNLLSFSRCSAHDEVQGVR